MICLIRITNDDEAASNVPPSGVENGVLQTVHDCGAFKGCGCETEVLHMETSAQQGSSTPDSSTLNVQGSRRFRVEHRLDTGVTAKYVRLGYQLLCRNVLALFLFPLGALLMMEILHSYDHQRMLELWIAAGQTDIQFNLVSFCGCVLLLVLVAVTYIALQKRPVYLLDFNLYKPDSKRQKDPNVLPRKVPHELFMDRSIKSEKFNDEALSFQKKIMARSGLGAETYLPPSLLCVPPAPSMHHAREEAKEVMFGTIADLLEQNGLQPSQVDILIVNCSLFNPTPSLSAMIVNHFKMKSNIMVYNLSGMGCSAGLIAIDLARQMLQLIPRARALVFSTENITQNWYFGSQKSMLIPNCLFRVGGAAILLTNRKRDFWKARYELRHVVRTHMGAEDSAFACVYQVEDKNKSVGVSLSKELMSIAGESLKANITTLGPLVLPVLEQAKFFLNSLLRKGLKFKIKPFIPDFKLAFDHFCIHTGGRAVIEEIEKRLKLTDSLVRPSKDTLFRFGNTSSSSIWYVLGRIESTTGVRQGDRVWQIAFGSGFKCNSAVWVALKSSRRRHTAWA